MIDDYRKSPGSPVDYFNKYRKFVLALAAISVYAALGFLLVPWLVQKNAITSVREMYGSELRFEKVDFNPLVSGMIRIQ